MEYLFRLARIGIVCVECVLAGTALSSVRAESPPPTTENSAPEMPPPGPQTPADSRGMPVACNRFLPADTDRPNLYHRVLFSVHVTAAGELRDPVMIESSYHDDLDQASLNCIPSLYFPVTREGKPAEVDWVIGIYWFGPWSTVHPPSRFKFENYCDFRTFARTRTYTEGTTILSFHVGTDGDVKDVVVDQSSGSAGLDQHAADCVSGWHYFPAQQNGQPVEIDWHYQFMWLNVR